MLKTVLLLMMLFLSPLIKANEQLENLLSQKRYEEAEAILSSALKAEDNEALRFMYARVLSWQGRNVEALEQFDILLKRSPDNADYLLGKARVLYWIKDYVNAYNLLTKARQLSPGYKDVWELQISVLRAFSGGEESVRLNKLTGDYMRLFPVENIGAASEKTSSPIVKVFSAYDYSTLDNKSPTWKEYNIGVAYLGGEHLTPVVSWSKVRRFDLDDSAVAADLYYRYFNHALYAGVSYSDEGILLPSMFYRFSLSSTIDNRVSFEGGYQQRQYSFLTTNSVSLAASMLSQYGVLTYKATTTLVDENNRTLSNELKMSFVISRKISVSYGINFGHELEVDGSKKMALYEVSGYLASVQAKLYRNFDIKMSYQHQKQGQAYVRNGYSAGLSYSF